ncbi:MAG: AI-2E family transporter [Deltaproteobacteria bacterium]|nr:AI-2E family transporter [Deltaproteobacteria bacterium]
MVRRWAIGLGVAALFFILISSLERVATLTLLSFLVAYVLDPLVTRLARLRYVSRFTATLIVLIALGVGFFAVLFVVIPDIVDEFRQFLTRMPDKVAAFNDSVVPWFEKITGLDVPTSVGEALTQIRSYVQALGPKLIEPATNVLTVAFSRTFSIIFAVVGAMMFPLFVFFLLKDFPRIIDAVDGLVPLRFRAPARQIAGEVDESLSAFLHGQFMVMLVLGTLYSVGYSIVGIPVAIGVGLLTGLLCFIPYVGAATGFVLALTLSVLDFQGAGRVVGVAVVFAAVQLSDAVFITPKILGGKLGLRPLWIIVALMAGGELFGFLGVLLAVPTTAVLKILIRHSIERYKKSSLFREPPAGESKDPGEAG